MKKLLIFLFLSLLTYIESHALILYGGDNSTNIENPENGLPFNNVVQVYYNGNQNGSAVYLGNGYFITANHVSVSTAVSQISADGTNRYSISTYYTPAKIGSTDLTIFYAPDAASDLGLTDVDIYTDTFRFAENVYLVGGGVGRSPSSAVGDNPVAWGGAGTADIRWGTNKLSGAYSNAVINGYTYNAYETTLNSNAGATEAALTVFDSGSGMFYRDNDGSWYLVGIATAVSASNTSTFEDVEAELTGGKNYFVNLASYASEIYDIISISPNVPEAASTALAFSIAASIVVVGMGRKRRD